MKRKQENSEEITIKKKAKQEEFDESDKENISYLELRCKKAEELKEMISTVVHDGKKLFTCNSCEYSSSVRTNIRRHIASKHEGKKPKERKVQTIRNNSKGKKLFTCYICGHSSSLEINIKQHIERIHEDKKPNESIIIPNEDIVIIGEISQEEIEKNYIFDQAKKMTQWLKLNQNQNIPQILPNKVGN